MQSFSLWRIINAIASVRLWITLWVAFIATPCEVLAVELPDAAKPSAQSIPRVDRRSVPDEGSVFLLPPAADRPLSAQEGERLIVRGFALRGVVDRPEYGVMIRDVEAILEARRVEKQQLQGDVIEGFTPGALVESAKILRELVRRRERGEATEQDLKQVQELIQKLKDVEYNQGLTIGQVQEIVDEVTRFYRSKGFLLAQAYIPAQTVTNGIVIVQVLEGTLSEIVVEGNKRYSDQELKAPFVHLLGTPVVKQPFETALLQLTDYPGLSAFGVFRPGKDIGSSQLVIKVQKEKIVNAMVSLDNYGSEYTGKYRTIIDFSLNDIVASQDRIFGNVYKTFNPSNGVYGSLGYEVPVVDNKNIIGISAARNEFTLEEIEKSVPGDGETTIGGIYYKRTLKRSRIANLYAKFALFRKRADVNLFEAPNQLPFRDDLAVYSADIQYDSIDPASSSINLGFFRYSHGVDGILGVPQAGEETRGKINIEATGEFDKVELGYTRLQSLTASNSLMLSLRGQYTKEALASLEQMAIGGPDSVRAYPIAKYLRDKAYLATVEWIMKAPGAADVPVFGNKTWGDVMKLSIFFDAGGGTNNRTNGDTVDDVSAMGLGVAVSVKIYQFNARLDVGWPLNEKEEDKNLGAQTYFSTSYQF